MTRRPVSITAGATLAFLASLAVAAALLLALLPMRNNAVIQRLETRSLVARAEMIAQHLQQDESGNWRLELPQEVAAAFSIVYGRASYAIVTAEGDFLMGAGAAAPLAIPAPTLQGFTLERNGRELQGVALPATVDGKQLSIQVAEDLRHPDVLLDDAADGLTRDIAWLVLPVFLALSAILMLALRRVRKPLRMLAARAENLSPARPGERLPEEDVPVELLPLVRRLNGLLDRVEAAQAEQRGFVADAAHELRTPLAVLQAHMDLLRDREAAAALGQDLWVLERMVGQLLAIAELDDVALAPAGPVDLRQLAHDVAALLRPLAEARDVTIETRLPATRVTLPGQEEALAQAIANLLENAIGHAPEGSAVTLALRSEVGLHVLDVSDAGPGIPEHERKLIFRRFWRARRRQDSRRRGVGLGLAIVQRAAVIHGGSVAVEEAPGGGALFSLRLPAAPGTDATVGD